jgi:hypothetical protein
MRIENIMQTNPSIIKNKFIGYPNLFKSNPHLFSFLNLITDRFPNLFYYLDCYSYLRYSLKYFNFLRKIEIYKKYKMSNLKI